MRKIKMVMLAILLLPAVSMAQMETKAGDMVLTAGTSISDISFGFNGNFQFNITNKIAAHPALNYNTMGGGSFLSVDAWAGYHGLSKIPYLNVNVNEKSNLDPYLMLGPTFYKGELSNGLAFGAGGGGRYYLNQKMAITVEAKYRMMLGNSYSYVKWYELGVGFSYAL
ncbi:MAG: hypothetical protein WD267_07735 [Balneolales bacterium]